MNSASPAVSLLETPLGFMARSTPQLRATVAQYQTMLPPAEFADLLTHLRSAFQKYTAKLMEFAPGVERGTALHQMMDHELKAVAQLPLSCGKGCTGCCHYEVEITQDEATVLHHAVLRGRSVDLDRLHLQAARQRQGPEWRQLGSRENRCVFLGDDGACQVYDERPSICRKHVVTSPAAACTTEGAAVAPVQVLLAEILLSAELSIEGTEFGSLSKMLLRAMHEAPIHRTAG